jgi:hypothetical protein
MQPVDLSESPADAIAHNRIPDFVRDGKADAVAASLVGTAVYGKTGCGDAVSFGIETPKFMILF